MLNESTKNMLKEAIGITDEDLNRLSPGIVKLLSKMEDFQKYKVVVEVTDSEYCFRQLKPGQKYVFSGGNLIPEETTAPFCLSALVPVSPILRMVYDRIVSGADPNDLWVKNTECLDTGIDNGGLGKVKFKIAVEKAT
jgi:uncharacterized repeat protein (TIGR04076 family)